MLFLFKLEKYYLLIAFSHVAARHIIIFSLDSSNYAAKIVALVHQNKHETIIGQLHADIYYFLKRSEINHNQSITHVNTSLPTVKIKENAFLRDNLKL